MTNTGSKGSKGAAKPGKTFRLTFDVNPSSFKASTKEDNGAVKTTRTEEVVSYSTRRLKGKKFLYFRTKAGTTARLPMSDVSNIHIE